MEHLKSLDTEFLHIEGDTAHMHIAGACVFDGSPPDYELLVSMVAGKMHKIPLYRRRIRTVPFELGRPVWVDDPDFDLRYHVRHTALPAPGDDATFTRLMGRLMSQPLDRERPLWEVWLVEGLEGGQWALVFKVHHSMVDGIAGVQLLTALLDVVPTETLEEPEPWSPRPEPTAVAKVLDAWKGLAEDAAASSRGLADAMRHPERAIAAATSTVRGLSQIIRSLGTTSERSPDLVIGSHRTWANASASLGDVKLVGRTFGGTVNDVVLAAVAGSFRELLLSQNIDPAETVIRSFVPVSTRHSDGQGVPDNRVSLILYDLPVSIADPVERLTAVHEQMVDRKQSHMTEAGEAIITISNLFPPMVVGSISRMVVRVMQRVPQRSVDTITTNVPGPQFPLYCLGREMLEFRPFVPIAYGIRLSTAIMSYNGKLFFGVTGDFGESDNADRLAKGAVDEISELHRLAVRPPRTSNKRSKTSAATNPAKARSSKGRR